MAVLDLTYRDQLSAGVDAAAAAMNSAADAADKLETSVTRLGPSADALTRRLDPATKAVSDYEKAQRTLTQATATMDAAVSSGTKSEAQRTVVLDTLRSKVTAARDAMIPAVPASDALSAAHGRATEAANHAAGAHAGFYREIVVLGHEMLQGNYSRLGGSVMVLAERSGNLEGIVKGLGSALAGWPGVMAAAALGLGALSVAAETTERRMGALQNALSLVRDDYAATATAADAAAKHLASTSFLSTADARTGINTIFSNPGFQGTGAQAEIIARAFSDLSSALGEATADWSRLKEAMNDPAALMQKLQDQDHLKGVNQALVDSVKNMQASGDKAGAFATVLNSVADAAKHVVENKTPLEKAVNDLKNAFTPSGQSLGSFGEVIGKSVNGVLASAIRNITTLVNTVAWARNALLPNGAQPVPQGASLGDFLSAGLAPMLPGGLARLYFGAGPGAPSGPAIDRVSPSIGLDLAAAAAQYKIDPELLARLQMAEGAQNADGSWQNSPTGAIGPMQVTGTTFRGLAKTVPGLTNPNDTTQNIQAGAALFAHLLDKYGDPSLAVLAYHDGETLIDRVLASGGNANASPAAIAEAEKILTGYGGNGRPPLQTPIDVSGATAAAGNGTGFGNTAEAVKKTADDLAKSMNVAGVAAVTAQTKIDGFNAGLKLNPGNQRYLDGLQEATKEYYNAISPAQTLLRTIELQTAGENQVADAWKDGAAAAAAATIQIKARDEALKLAAPTDSNFATIQQAITDALTRQADAAQRAALNQQQNDQQRQLEFLRTELDTLNESADVRARELAMLQKRQDIIKTYPGAWTAEKEAVVQSAGAIADQTTRLQQNQAAMQEVGNLATQAFDQVGNAITNAFVGGSGAAVNFGNVARGVVASVLQEVLKLAVINPILNSAIGGQNRSTLDQVLSAIGGVGAIAGGGGSVDNTSTFLNGGASGSGPLGSLGTLFNAGSTLNGASGALGGPTLGSSLGLTGENGIFSSLGLTGSNGLISGASSSVSSVLSTPVLSSIGSTATIGTLFSGIGLGAGAGTLANTAVGGSANGAYGALGGAAAGAAVGSIVPGIGTVIGALVGGLIGGLGIGTIGPQQKENPIERDISNPLGSLLNNNSSTGLVALATLTGLATGPFTGLFGPSKPNAFSSTAISLDANGRADVGRTLAQIDNPTQERTQAVSDVGALNAFLDSVDLKLKSLGGLKEIGQPFRGGSDGKFSDLGSAFSGFQFSAANDNTLNTYLAKQSFPDLASFEADVTEYENLIKTVIPGLTTQAKVTGTLNDAIAQITATFGPAIDAAQKYGVATDTLTQAQQKAIDDQTAAANKPITDADNALTSRFLNANGKDPLGVQLYAFDINAQQQRDAFSVQLVNTYGDVVKNTQTYTDQMALLEKTLGAERVAIQRQYNDQLALAATGAVTNLESYVSKIQFGSQSPLNAKDQLSLATSQFQAVAGAAKAGDFNSVSQLSGFADNFLAASRVVNGSGAAYATDFRKVLDALTAVSANSSDALTASVLQAETRTQTQILVDELTKLRAAVAAVQSQIAQTSATPARLTG